MIVIFYYITKCMNNILETVKKIGLFLFGIVLVIWGYAANHATNNKGALSIKGYLMPLMKDIEKQLKQQQDSLARKEKSEAEKLLRKSEVTLPKKDAVVKETNPKKVEDESSSKVSEEPKTVIEPEKAEEASGTE